MKRVSKHVHRLYLRRGRNLLWFFNVQVNFRWTIQMLRYSIDLREIVVNLVELDRVGAIFIDEIESSANFVIMKVGTELQHHPFELGSV